MISYGHQSIAQEDIDAVIAVLRSDYLTQGPVVPQFEQAVAARVQAKHAVAVNSGTSALHIACLALGLGPGDLLWTVPNTFVASANCGRYCGANVDFVDIDPITWNMSVDCLHEKLEYARSIGTLPKVVVSVHFAGQPTDQEQIWELAREFDFRVLEDACHSIGASRNEEPVGSCRWSDITVFSFHPVKVITTGEGGMALTNDDELAWRMAMLRTHGITRDEGRYIGNSPGTWYYEQQDLGFNYRMTDIQGALGLSQLSRLEEFTQRRNQLAHRYNQSLQSLPLHLPTVREENRSAFHIYVVRLLQGGVHHSEVFTRLRNCGIGVNVHYTPVHLQPYYRKLGFSPGAYPEAEAHGNRAVTPPLHPALTEDQQQQVITSVRSCLA